MITFFKAYPIRIPTKKPPPRVTAFYPITRIDVLDRLLPLFIGTIPPTLAISWQIRQSIINENDTKKEASIRWVLKSGSFSLLLLPKPKGI